ncbi:MULTISPECIES: patatin-like phospholipase family protein [unclassified Lebetimonas]|uniref:patatin-like phospholipase family protein n=1 Tax=unclassified Lebetimonas TaxID=2648158 RepID=UPI000467CAF9|nr:MULTISPECIES: patatin-like phospholipase family protein [unclassified Lebetimonas]
MKINLALSGGAFRGAFHLGFLEAIDSKIDINAISGSSIGALIGASYACGVKPQKQLELLKSKAFKKVFKFNSLTKGFFKIDINSEIAKKFIPLSTFEELNIKTYVNALDLNSGKIIYFEKGDLKKAVLASSAIMPFFPPVELDNLFLVDGGIKENLPVGVFKEGIIVGVDLFPLKKEFKKSFFGILKRMFYLSWRVSSEGSIKKCNFYITDERLSDYKLCSFKNFDDLFEMGYERGEEFLNSF